MIHQFQLNGYNIVLDVHSGAVHVVDSLAYDMLELLEAPLAPQCPGSVRTALAEYSSEDIDQAYSDIYALWQDGILFSEDDYAPYADAVGDSPVKAMCLHIAHDCNLRCKYCFASTGDFGGGRAFLDARTGRKAIDYLLAHSGSRRNLELDFFGGEPLMNFDVVKEIVEYARSKEAEHGKRFRFTITTNGLLLDDEKIDYINREMYNVVLSIDGRREINDRLRPAPNGGGSYDRIVSKYQKLVADRLAGGRSGNWQYYVRGTFTKHNLDFAEDVLHLNELGFSEVSVEPVVAAPGQDYAITEADLPRIFEEYERLAGILLERRAAGKGFNFFHFMVDLNQGPCAIKRLRGCGCGNEYVAVTPDGDVFPCHQFVGMDEWKMGSVHDASIDRAMKGRFAASTVYRKEGCRDCWAKFYCSGGCNANNQQYAGGIEIPHGLSCALEKKRLECAVMMQAAMAE